MSAALAHAPEFDKLEAAMACAPQACCPVSHRFTPGLYIREILLPAGTLLTSAIHKTEHPFVVSAGIVRVMEPGQPPVTIEAPYTGITTPGTRRLLYAIEDTIWTTFHPTTRGEDEMDQIMLDLVEDPPHLAKSNFLPGYKSELHALS